MDSEMLEFDGTFESLDLKLPTAVEQISSLQRSLTEPLINEKVFLPTKPCRSKSNDEQESSKTDASPQVYARTEIEKLIGNLADSLAIEDAKLCIKLKIKPSASRTTTVNSENSDIVNHTAYREVCFPGKTPKEAWTFATLIRVLELIHEALVNETPITKRDIFYKDPALFGKQEVVDRHVDDIARTFGIPRTALNVGAAAKGLFSGDISIMKTSGGVIAGAKDRAAKASLVPFIHVNDTVCMDKIKWILVVEKEATFRSILASEHCSALLEHGLIITGKGYPDIVTRLALNRFCSAGDGDENKQIPVYGLVDYDPDGLAILSTYKYGSATLAHEGECLCTPRISWIGLQCSDISEDGKPSEGQGLLSLTNRDHKKALRMLCWWHLSENGVEKEWRRELQVMLMLNIKAEIQILDETSSDGFVRWLNARMFQD